MADIDSIITKIGFGKFHIVSLLILGSNNAYYAMQILTVTLLGPILACQWKINIFEVFLVTSSAFVGIMIGSVAMGNLSDNYGRKTILLISNIGLIHSGIMTAISPTIQWMIANQFITGVFTSGLGSSLFALQSELTPIKFGGTVMVTYELFWAVESFLVTILCFLILPIYGWRSFLFITTIPIILVTIALVWVPESPRFLLLHHGKSKALKVLNRIAEMNKFEFICDIYDEPVMESSFRDLVHRNYFSTTILTCFMSFIGCLTYYSIILLITIINEVPHRCLQNMDTFSMLPVDVLNNTIDNSCCSQIAWETYKNMLISIFAEVIFMPITIIVINFTGRKKTFALYSSIIIVGIFLLNFCLGSIAMTILLFFIRGSTSAYFSLNYIYATEVFPTSVRSLGIGLGSTCARFGAVLASCLVNIIVWKFSFSVATSSLCFLNVLGLIACFLLPYETKDRKLYQTAYDENCIKEIFPEKSQYWRCLK